MCLQTSRCCCNVRGRVPLLDDKKRFYLLPGQGGRAYYRKQRVILVWAIVAGLLISSIVVLIVYFLNPANK